MKREKYLSLFVDESKENLLALNEYLLELEKASGDLRVLNDIFRVAHTLKGMSSAMGFTSISELTHEMENLLDFLRNAQLAVTSDVIDILFICLDSLENLIDATISNETKTIDITSLMFRLKKLLNIATDIPENNELITPNPESLNHPCNVLKSASKSSKGFLNLKLSSRDFKNSSSEDISISSNSC